MPAEFNEQFAAAAAAMVATEIGRQDRMWGASNERADTSKDQLQQAAAASLALVMAKKVNEEGKLLHPDRLIAGIREDVYPDDWAGFRDYGSDIANLAVAAAYIQQEIKRKLALGEDYTRTSRTAAQPYGADQPYVIEK